jgi:CheY-like chemotaxis protein
VMAASAASPKQLPQGAEGVLVVDDNPAVAAITSKVLERAGYRVEVCPSGADALARVSRDPESVSLVLTDQTMPGMQGLELAQALANAGYRMPVMLLSGRAHEFAHVQQVNVSQVLNKPVMPSDLLHCVREVLDAGNITKVN